MTKRSTPSALTLPSVRVDVVEQGQSAHHQCTKCEIEKNIKFKTAGLEAYCLANWDARVFDAMVLAAAVQFCDHIKARPKTGWGREITLRVPVHDPAHWNSPDVSGHLHEALGFLTGDRWAIEFVGRKSAAERPRQATLSMPDGSRVIIPYSDGLDSRAVSGIIAKEKGDRLIRVRMGSKLLGGGYDKSVRLPFALVPYRVKFGREKSVESSGRSRGFKFALLSAIAAFLSQAEEIVVPESGQGVLGPTLIPVGQAYDDFRNHPLFTNRMSAFIKALFGHEVSYRFPRLWYTKGETLAEYITQYGEQANWKDSWSCWRSNRQVSVEGHKRQCGICAACMLRRLSVHAAGGHEDPTNYIWEDLSAPEFAKGAASGFELKNPRGAHYEYAIAGVLHLDHLADLRHSDANRSTLDRKVMQLSHSLGLSEQETATKLNRLLERHESEWKAFLESLGPQSFVARWVSGGS